MTGHKLKGFLKEIYETEGIIVAFNFVRNRIRMVEKIDEGIKRIERVERNSSTMRKGRTDNVLGKIE